MKRKLLALSAASLLSVISAPASSSVNYVPSYGLPAADAPFYRTIRITDTTKYVNVTQYETVRFVARDASGKEEAFAWNFSTNEAHPFPFSDIAPSGFTNNRLIRVYLQRAHFGGD